MTGESIKTQKLTIQIKTRELHKNLTKPSSEVDCYGTRPQWGDVIIGDKFLKKYMPPQVK